MVKLNESGYRVWKTENERWITLVPTRNPQEKEYKKHCIKIGVRSLAWYKKQADKKGYVEFQMWNFIEMFGDYTGMAVQSYYETNILIKQSNLKPIK